MFSKLMNGNEKKVGDVNENINLLQCASVLREKLFENRWFNEQGVGKKGLKKFKMGLKSFSKVFKN